MSKHEEEVEEEEVAPFWVISFSDMMTLLLTFFIMLFSMSTVEKSKADAAIDSLRERFGFTILEGGLPGQAGTGAPTGSDKSRARGRTRISELGKGNPALSPRPKEASHLRLARQPKDATSRGIVYFDLGSSELNNAAKTELAAIAEQIKGTPTHYEIRGHTSEEHGLYSNDMILLGFLRAKAVFDELQQLGVNPKHMRASSAGMNEPIPEMLKISGVTAQQANAFVEILEVSE